MDVGKLTLEFPIIYLEKKKFNIEKIIYHNIALR